MSEQDEAFEQWLTVGHHILCTDTKRAYHNAFGSGWDARGEHDAASRSRNWEARTMDTFDCRRCGECQTQRQPEPFYCPTCDAAELARKDELLKAYRALNAAGVRLCDGNKTESEWSSRAKEWRAAQAKVAKLEAGR